MDPGAASHRHGYCLAAFALITAALVTPAAASGLPGGAIPLDPGLAGRWSAPFEEGGAARPRCSGDPGQIVCKPVAQAMAVLPDGRVFYFSGFDGQPNEQKGTFTDKSPRARDSQARVLDLRDGSPRWSVPGEPTGGATDPDIRPGARGTDDVLGLAGVPGRPGDGLVGSTAGALGLPGHPPTSPPDDTQANDGDLFCAEVVQLEDGRLLIAGGSDWYNEPAFADQDQGAPTDAGLFELQGLRSSRIFDPATDSFAQTGHMKFNRWYPAAVTLSDGKVLIAGGATKVVKNTQAGQVRRTETFDPVTDAWTENYTGPASENSLPFLPRLHLMPNGKVFYSGAGASSLPFVPGVDEPLWAIQQFFNLETKQWELVGPAPLVARNGSFQAMLPLAPPYDAATLLVVGGTLASHPNGLLASPVATLTTVDRAGHVTNELTGSLHHARWFASGVLLPDGTVLALGGSDREGVSLPGTDVAVKTPEVYDPVTGRWTEVALHARARAYHHSALLLPDGRVLLGGHAPVGYLYGPPGGPGQETGAASDDSDPSFEIWSPPYLFRGPRPVIAGVRAGVRFGETFPITTPQADEIESVVLMRAPSPQHVIDSDARSLTLSFSRSQPGELTAVAPPDGVVAPPGWYYLFVNRRTAAGPVPSVARMVHLGETGDRGEAGEPFRPGVEPGRGGTATPHDRGDSFTATRLRLDPGPPGPAAPPEEPGLAGAAMATGPRRPHPRGRGDR